MVWSLAVARGEDSSGPLQVEVEGRRRTWGGRHFEFGFPSSKNYRNIACAVKVLWWLGQGRECATFAYGGGCWRLVLVVLFLGVFHIAVGKNLYF